MKKRHRMKKQLFTLIPLIAPFASVQSNEQERYEEVMGRLRQLESFNDFAIKAHRVLKGAYTRPTFDYRNTVNAFETADRMRKEAIIHYENALAHLSSMPKFELQEILETSIKESAKTGASNPRERIIKYVTAMAIEIMSNYGVEAITCLTRFSYEIIHAITLMESAEELTKISPSLSSFYDSEDQDLLINATMALVNIDLYTYAFISPKDGYAVSNYFRSVRDEFFEHLKKYKKMNSCLCYDMLYKIQNFNLICLCLENTPREFSAEMIHLAMQAAEDLFYLEHNTGIKHYTYYEDGGKERVDDFCEIEWRAY